MLLVETPSELEKQIAKARRAVTATYIDARAQVQGVISRWISVEESVESACLPPAPTFPTLLTNPLPTPSHADRIKSLIAPDEPLTPGILYVGVATLTGSVLARNRSLALRLSLPPTLLLLSLTHFLPKTSANVAAYAGALEDAYLPALAEKHDIARAHSAMAWARAVDAAGAARERAGEGVLGAVVRLEEATGLKLQETMGWSRGAAGKVEGQVREAAHVVQVKAEEASAAVAQKVEEAKSVAVEKVHEATAAVEKKADETVAAVEKADEPPKRLV